MQLLWRGIAAYVDQQGIDLMFGCASLNGTDPDALAQELTFLYGASSGAAGAAGAGVAGAVCGDAADGSLARLMPGERRCCLPPLIKGYMRLGGLRGRRGGHRPALQYRRCGHHREERSHHR